MTLSIDVDDMDVFDETETVTLRKVNALTGGTTDYTGITALGEALAETVLTPGEVQMVPQRITWHLQKSTITAGVVPDRDDRIISTSTRLSGTYVIFSVDKETWGTRYVCPTQKLVS